jgi:hypothetical protein
VPTIIARWSRVDLVVGGSLRHHAAQSPAYDLVGGSVLAQVRRSLTSRLAVTVAAALLYDNYLHSGGREGLAVFASAEKRREWIARVSSELTAAIGKGTTLGLRYEFGGRRSTISAESGPDYGYREHRLLAVLGWRFAGGDHHPRTVDPRGHVPLDYGFGPSPAASSGFADAAAPAASRDVAV